MTAASSILLLLVGFNKRALAFGDRGAVDEVFDESQEDRDDLRSSEAGPGCERKYGPTRVKLRTMAASMVSRNVCDGWWSASSDR